MSDQTSDPLKLKWQPDKTAVSGRTNIAGVKVKITTASTTMRHEDDESKAPDMIHIIYTCKEPQALAFRTHDRTSRERERERERETEHEQNMQNTMNIC